MYTSINTKLTAIISIGSLLTLGCVYLAVAFFYNENINYLIDKDLRQADQLVKEQIRLDTNKLGAALEVFLSDHSLIETFQAGKRSELIKQANPVFEKLKSSYGITHLYFHLPDGTVFLRVHKPALFGDTVRRATFEKARKTGIASSGLDLGATAFALRIVAPIYRDGEIIGYLELGEEIDDFITFLKGVTGNEYALVVNKQSVDRQQFNTLLAARGHSDGWDRMQNYVTISEPVTAMDSMDCLNEKNVGAFMTQHGFDRSFSPGARMVCGGFPIVDANGAKVGALVTLINFSQQARILSNMRNIGVLLVALMFAITFSGIILLAKRFIIRPLEEISRAAQIFATGELKDHRIPIQSNDEIGILAESINEMAMQLDQHYSNAVERSVELEQLNLSLEALATTDGLTGLHNHRYFFQKLIDEIARCRRYEHPLTLIMVDLDFFKNYNDANGHLNGDELLRKIAVIFLECSRDIDVVARYGGEEFVIILPETDMAEAFSCAERIRARVAATVFPRASSQPSGRVTVSLGVALLTDDMKDVSDFVEQADQALYRAKNMGRNRVEI